MQEAGAEAARKLRRRREAEWKGFCRSLGAGFRGCLFGIILRRKTNENLGEVMNGRPLPYAESVPANEDEAAGPPHL